MYKYELSFGQKTILLLIEECYVHLLNIFKIKAKMFRSIILLVFFALTECVPKNDKVAPLTLTESINPILANKKLFTGVKTFTKLFGDINPYYEETTFEFGKQTVTPEPTSLAIPIRQIYC